MIKNLEKYCFLSFSIKAQCCKSIMVHKLLNMIFFKYIFIMYGRANNSCDLRFVTYCHVLIQEALIEFLHET